MNVKGKNLFHLGDVSAIEKVIFSSQFGFQFTKQSAYCTVSPLSGLMLYSAVIENQDLW